MESRWRQNVADFGFSFDDVRLFARVLQTTVRRFALVAQYSRDGGCLYVSDDSGQTWRYFTNENYAGHFPYGNESILEPD